MKVFYALKKEFLCFCEGCAIGIAVRGRFSYSHYKSIILSASRIPLKYAP